MNKQNPRDAAFVPLATHGVVALHGRDAVAFAQAQLMNDLGAMSPGFWQWNGWLTPKGRVIALFAALQLDSETLWLISQDSNAQALAEALRRYVFRSKVMIAVLDHVRIEGAFAAPSDATGNRLVIGDDGVVELDMGGEGGARCLRLRPLDTVATTDDADAVFTARWTGFDLAHGLPHPGDGAEPQWTPQQLSLQRLRAYSVAKGCYPGQEIVARTHFLGEAKRGLVRLRSPAPVAVGAEVALGGRAIGSVVSAQPVPGEDSECELLAVLPIATPEDARLLSGDLALGRLPLLDGLAR